MGYRLLYLLFFTLSLLPLGMLYLFADFLAWLAGSVVKYRRRVVLDNLRSSFPEKSEKELHKIARDFYRFLADYFVETVKLTTMSRREIEKRMRFENVEQMDEVLREGRNVSVFLGHYCNWEWISSFPLHKKAAGMAGQIYHPLENRVADRLFLHIRQRFGAVSIPMASTLQTLMKWKREGVPSVTGYIADQVPGYDGIHLFLDFLHHPDTPVFTGAERISRMFGAAGFYAHVERPRRGYYVCRFEKIAENASDLPIFELTRRYYERLEAQIEAAPQYWLWSHRRWKRTRAGFYEYHGADADRLLRRL